MGYQWTGADGIRYDTSTAKDSHLQYAHRLWVERTINILKSLTELRQLYDSSVSDRQRFSLSRSIVVLQDLLNALDTGIVAAEQELQVRGLSVLSPRTAEEQAQAKLRREQWEKVQAVKEKRAEQRNVKKVRDILGSPPVPPTLPPPVKSILPKVGRAIRLPKEKGDT